MMIFERELGLMDQAGAIEAFTAIERQDDAKRHYELLVKLVEQDESYTITNARQSPRSWVHLNTLIEFLRGQCPNFVTHRFGAGEPALSLIFGVKKTESKE